MIELVEVPGTEVRYFKMAEIEAARQWLSAPSDRPEA